MGSHLWAALFPLHQHLPCHLFCCWNGQQTGRSDSISYILRLMYRTECDSARRNEEGQGLTVGTSGCGVLQLSALCSSFALSSLTTTFRECFLAPFIVKTHTPWPGNCTLTEYSSIQLSLCILAYVTFLNPSWSVLLLFKGPILFDRTKVTEKSEKHWGSSSSRVYIPFQHFEKRGCSTFCFMLHPETLPTSLACISRHLVIR